MHDVFEVAFRDKISAEAVIDFFSQYFSIAKECIVSEDDYWAEIWEGKERVGCSIQMSSAGLKTNVSGVSSRLLDDIALLDLAKEGARKFDSEVVIGDYRKHGLDARGSFLSVFPDGTVWESVDASRGSISDVKALRSIKI